MRIRLFSLALLLTVAGCSSTGESTSSRSSNGLARGAGIVTVASQNSVAVTIARLKSAIESNPNLTLIAELNHSANAASAGMDLRPTWLLMFGNPKLGTPLMQTSQTAGLDLPQKMLVYENASGAVTIAYNDPMYVASRHGIEGQSERLDTIAKALAGLASGAATRDG